MRPDPRSPESFGVRIGLLDRATGDTPAAMPAQPESPFDR
jgi:hypothetical protein